MITPQTFTRRTDSITVVEWDVNSIGDDEKAYFEADLGANWTVTLQSWRTITCTDGATTFSIDRGGMAAKGADNNWAPITEEQLKLFFTGI